MTEKGEINRKLPLGFIKEQEIKIQKELNSYLDRKEISQAVQVSDTETGLESQYLNYVTEKQRKIIPRLERVLNLIKNGQYGVCQRCGGDIEMQRLALVPSAIECCTCIKCLGL